MIINQGLMNGANDWWYSAQDSIETWLDFEQKSLDRYWSTELQRKLRLQVFTGKYVNEGRLSRVEYATRLCNNARDINMTEEDVVLAIGEHFDRETSNSIWGWKIKALNELIQFLDRVDSQKRNVQNNQETRQQGSSPTRPKPWQVKNNEKSETKKVQSINIESTSQAN